MRLSPSYYPEYVDIYCPTCDDDYDTVQVDSIEGEDVVVFCPVCDEAVYVRVVE